MPYQTLQAYTSPHIQVFKSVRRVEKHDVRREVSHMHHIYIMFLIRKNDTPQRDKLFGKPVPDISYSEGYSGNQGVSVIKLEFVYYCLRVSDTIYWFTIETNMIVRRRPA